MKRRVIALILSAAAIHLCACSSGDSDKTESTLSFVPEPQSSQASSGESSGDISSTETPEDCVAKLSFAGDILVHSTIYESAEKSDGTYDFTKYFTNTKGFFTGDLNMVNMETPVDAYGDNTRFSNYPRFNTPREIIDALIYLGVDTVSNVNNHSFDCGTKGYVQSTLNLREKLNVVGSFVTEDEFDIPYIADVNGIKIGILAYQQGTGTSAYQRKFELSMNSVPQMLEDVAALRKAGAEFTIVTLHWGSEYKDAPADIQKKIAYALTDGGVDLIVGGHSHCVQPIERRTVTVDGVEKEAIIMYSLGNLLADQVSLQRTRDPSYAKTQEGMKVDIELTKDGETGKISFTDASYTPTYFYRKSIGGGKYQFDLIRLQEYAEAETMPEIFKNETDWKKCVSGYARVQSVVGDAIRLNTDDISGS